MNVVVLGAGVVGCAVAYYLSLRGIAATVVESVGVACAASGKSGGFLASNWCEGQPQEQLARLSFDLHTDLADNLVQDYGYRRMTTLAVATSARHSLGTPASTSSSTWIDGDCVVRGVLGDTSSTAQVDPAQFTRALLETAQKNGAALRIGVANAVTVDKARGRVDGVLVNGDRIEADAVVLAMGPWTQRATSWLPLPNVYGSKSYSIVVETQGDCPTEALFVEYEDEQGDWHGPEVIPRENGEVYMCGFGDDTPVPDSPDDVWVDNDACDRLHALASRLSSVLAAARILRRQACYRPICRDAMPVLGALDGVKGAYIVTGHNCWGILNAPASGYALAELIAEGESRTIDLGPFAPGRLPLASAPL